MELRHGGNFNSCRMKGYKKVLKFKRDFARGRAKNSKNHITARREMKVREARFVLNYMNGTIFIEEAINKIETI